MSPVRKEKDSLGEVDVPAEALYGAQTSRAVGNFPISGMKANSFLIRALAMVKLAAAEANRELGLISKEQGDAIVKAAEEVLGGKHHEHFVVDVFQAGAGVSLHMNANEVLANRANQILGEELGSYKKVHPNDHVNYGQSTNDVFPTAMRLCALAGARRAVSGAGCAGGELCGEGGGVQRCAEGRAHAYAGRSSDHAGAGVCGVCSRQCGSAKRRFGVGQ